MRLSGQEGTGQLNRQNPIPYLVIGLAWFGFLMMALRVRLVEPVFLWVMTQGLLVERAIGRGSGFWSSHLFLLTAYMGAALLAWWIVERPGQSAQHVWRRAILAWLGIQALYCVTATILVQAGILYE
jgi:hypothetical protein